MYSFTSLVSDSLQPHGLSPPGSSVHGISQVRILEWGANSSLRGSSLPGIKPASPALQADSLPSEPSRKLHTYIYDLLNIDRNQKKTSKEILKIFSVTILLVMTWYCYFEPIF